ncbi:hypothetical protein Zmor_014651 [Zophobas morio]|uniref:Reverse transcriptase domain-containing protein n=1 Tax=Zophobas morio TaxID=2755281 RepID=A0AA38MH06_9CUCU|nr:hypothetical protein Zmor_014651 [Zophobas morio]
MIPKPGKDPHNPLSYRPISLLNIMGKIFEKILTNRLKTFLETNNIIPQQQVHTDAPRFANLKECTIAVFIDIERAFDKVWHDELIYKFIKRQINPKFIMLLDWFLHNRSCRVKIHNTLSQPVNIRAGVPQGSVLSPILYSVYCSDFPFADTPRTKTRMFADDTAIWASHRNPDRAILLTQEALRRAEKWSNDWRVKPNPLKSQSICMSYPRAFTKQRKFRESGLTLHAEQIPKQNTVRYLGITFSHNCSLNPDLETSLKKVRNRSNLLYHIRGCTRGCNPETLKFTYNTYIRPIIDYRAPIYATLSKKCLKNRCMRKKNPPPYLQTKLQRKYVIRTINANNNTIALNTLHTTHKHPTANNRLLNRLPRVPKHKIKFPPTALLETVYPDLPQTLLNIMEDTPISMRRS